MLSIIAGLALSAQIYTHQPSVYVRPPYRVPSSSKYLPDHRRNGKELPNTQTTLSLSADSNITLKAGDNRVTNNLLSSAVKIINQTSLSILSKYAGSTPTQAVNIILFSSPQTYGNALIQAGIPADDIAAYTANTGGITIGSNIWIPLYNLKDISQLANVMTHELTHVTFNQIGSGDKLPTWINEGAAWRDGLLAEQQLDSLATSLEMLTEQRGVLQAVTSGQLLPLTATEQDILNANYNVEYEDFMAVESLVKQYGADKFIAFLDAAKSNQQDADEAFQTTYKIRMVDFQNTFLKSLQSEAK
ncbi:peptidase MA family metallohydrolase [Desulfosporosinus sp. OT]|uniref:peptidase MA family metallohydrolase n=1 Tax=Desulfosporosinus sp. OT TaxID=913865 RepID=UPI000223AF94|nr:peptidase MA family metallohydrolase [Desulfosporosinus sp. OT]EGW36814.1 hypothetical protein DOT_5279 [Desulfosporosinus sp. OT]